MNTTPNSPPLRSPEPKRPFVNRGRELQLIRDKLEIGKKGKLMPSVVVCFSGPFGIGKSWLLYELEHRHRNIIRQIRKSATYPPITARLDLNRTILPALWQDNRLKRTHLITELWKQLAKQLPEGEVPDLGRASAEEWANAFVKKVTGWSSEATPIIMLDTMDDLVTQDEKTFFWLEQHLVEPLAMTDRVLFVFTSRGELRRWKRFQVRRRADLHKLTVFDYETVGQEVGASNEASKVLYRHTFGHPLFTERLGTILERRKVNLQQATEKELHLEPSLLRDTLSEVINEILEAVPELPANLARYTCVLRWVSVEPLRFLGEDSGLTKSNQPDKHYLGLIDDLQAHHLLYWNNDKNSYAYDPVLRQLLVYFLELDQPKRFRAAHLTAFNFHHNHLQQSPQYLGRYVPELAYHRAILDRCEPLEPQPVTLQAWWEQFLSEKAPPHPRPWAELLEAIEQDNELKDILPPEDYERLQSEAQNRASKMATK